MFLLRNNSARKRGRFMLKISYKLLILLTLFVSASVTTNEDVKNLMEQSEKLFNGIGMDLDVEKAEQLLLKVHHQGNKMPFTFVMLSITASALCRTSRLP